MEECPGIGHPSSEIHHCGIWAGTGLHCSAAEPLLYQAVSSQEEGQCKDMSSQWFVCFPGDLLRPVHQDILRYTEPIGYNGRRIGYYSYYGGLPYFKG